ncbi:hypothetical protein D3C84_1086490 [compost metagenome]
MFVFAVVRGVGDFPAANQKGLTQHTSPVGAGLLANAVRQPHVLRLTLPLREQARSHKGVVVWRMIVSGTKKPRIKRGFFMGVWLTR